MSRPLYVNLTPHKITVFSPNNLEPILKVKPSGKVARVEVRQEVVEHLEDRIPVHKTVFGDIYVGEKKIESVLDVEEMLSEWHVGDGRVVFIVSLLVLQAMRQKKIPLSGKDWMFVAPDTNPKNVVRDSSGRILGVKAFQVI